MTLRVIVEEPARGDLAAAVRWYKHLRPGLDADFRLCVRATLDRLVRHPESSPLLSRGVRRALIDRFPFAIFYRADGKTLRVFAVLHTSRDPRIWHSQGH